MTSMIHELWQLSSAFRSAIDAAKNCNAFVKDAAFNCFPVGCCGDTSELLAQYFSENGIETAYVCGTYWEGGYENRQSHAWLLAEESIIIDITGDQFRYDPVFLFYDKAVYVGPMDDFHRLFEIEDKFQHGFCGIYVSKEAAYLRLQSLYETIIQHVKYPSSQKMNSSSDNSFWG